MKNKIRILRTKQILVAFVFVFAFFSCKKYPEGPYLTFRTPYKRIEGTWETKEFLVNSADSTKFLTDSIGKILVFNVSTASTDKTHYIDFPNINLFAGSNWDFYNDYDSLWIDHLSLDEFFTFGPFKESWSNWKIKKLTKKEFWIETEYAENNYKWIMTR